MTRGAWACAGSVVGAGVLHAIAGRHLAGADPIGAMLGGHAAGVVAAAIGLAAARLFLFFVAPGWAAYLIVSAAARAIYMPPK
jgi:hypothetical protein